MVVSLGVSVIGLFGIALCYLLVDRIGRKPVQVWGFGILVVVFFVLGIASNRGFVLMAIFFVIVELADQGPGITTYLFAGELFPTSVRASGHGTATAASRIGAFLGIVALPVFVSGCGTGTGAADLRRVRPRGVAPHGLAGARAQRKGSRLRLSARPEVRRVDRLVRMDGAFQAHLERGDLEGLQRERQ